MSMIESSARPQSLRANESAAAADAEATGLPRWRRVAQKSPSSPGGHACTHELEGWH